jgi:hypothetical protein
VSTWEISPPPGGRAEHQPISFGEKYEKEEEKKEECERKKAKRQKIKGKLKVKM